MKKTLVLLAVAVTAALAQPALADSRHHHRGQGNGWVPFVAVPSWRRGDRLLDAAAAGLCTTRLCNPTTTADGGAAPYYAPAPLYAVPAPPPGYYYERY
jgi:hypothetical protein